MSSYSLWHGFGFLSETKAKRYGFDMWPIGNVMLVCFAVGVIGTADFNRVAEYWGVMACLQYGILR